MITRAFPHPRGDVPEALAASNAERDFSPPAWGCSVSYRIEYSAPALFPTRVGMFRASWTRAKSSGAFPHPRGDVPRMAFETEQNINFSPPAWGCSANSIRLRQPDTLFPTRVGMFRGCRVAVATLPTFPHPRGDVPTASPRRRRSACFSPPAWGCSGAGNPAAHHRPLFPTRVGMFRLRGNGSSIRSPFPHPRGDVPPWRKSTTRNSAFSPPAWGCSDTCHLPKSTSSLFPTRVGMFRTCSGSRRCFRTFPHPRGDVPGIGGIALALGAFSPPAWGCSVPKHPASCERELFPTRVGMFRWNQTLEYRPCSFPHPRGDVPESHPFPVSGLGFSPPAWGCSAVGGGAGGEGDLFPTRVGMFRGAPESPFATDPFPHPRGDVPLSDVPAVVSPSFSPPAWGCSGRRRR